MVWVRKMMFKAQNNHFCPCSWQTVIQHHAYKIVFMVHIVFPQHSWGSMGGIFQITALWHGQNGHFLHSHCRVFSSSRLLSRSKKAGLRLKSSSHRGWWETHGSPVAARRHRILRLTCQPLESMCSTCAFLLYQTEQRAIPQKIPFFIIRIIHMRKKRWHTAGDT